MSKDNIIQLIQPTNVDDQLTEILRTGARALLAQAVEAEVADFLGKHADLKTEDGHQRVVRHGHLPEREVMTGIGPVAVRQPRVRDRLREMLLTGLGWRIRASGRPNGGWMPPRRQTRSMRGSLRTSRPTAPPGSPPNLQQNQLQK